MTLNPERLRRDAKALKKGFAAGEAKAQARVAPYFPDAEDLRHSAALHVVAREAGYDSWPRLKLAADSAAMDRAERVKRLKMAIYHGQIWVIDQMLEQDPSLGDADFAVQVSLYRAQTVARTLERDAEAATRRTGPRSPILHLAFSRYHQSPNAAPEDAIAIAEMLLEHGADVNDGYPYQEGDTHLLSALYGAIGHSDNLPLAQWLLEHGADPNDNESLYHSTELGHHDGLDLLLAHGAKPAGTNALLRAMDFNDYAAVEKLLAAGADPNEGIAQHPSGQPPEVVSALHQAARRGNDRRMVEVLLRAGADLEARYQGISPYAMARAFGSAEAAAALAEAGADTALPPEIALIAAAADGPVPDGQFVDTAMLPEELRNLLRAVITEPDKFDFARRLVEIGIEWDRPDNMGLTPVQIAGWEGLPDQMKWLLGQRPDLGHVNDYGGTLLSTVIHGSENCPARNSRDHIACARLALEHGVALPKAAIRFAGDPDMAAFLADWAEAHPGQVVEEGVG